MEERIRHDGRIESVQGTSVKVRILQSSACGSCSAAKLCRSSETKEKVIEIVTQKGSHYKVGQGVTIVGSMRQGMWATVWAYVIPLILVIAALIVASTCGLNDALAAGISLIVLALYFVVMYALRNRFEKKFAFEIED